MKRARTTKPGKVEKVIKAVVPNEKDKAEIHIPSAEPLYQEIRIDNELKDPEGGTVELKPGDDVEIHIEADKETPKQKTEDVPEK
jgi:hypothetical protein